MKSIAKLRRISRLKRHRRIRKNLQGTPVRPRLAVYRSHLHIYTQIIDDLRGQNGETLLAISTQTPEVRTAIKGMSKSDASREVGKFLAKQAAEKGIAEVKFDRGGYRYHGRVKALAEGARKNGLKF